MIERIERAIADRIKSASNAGALGYQFETIASYGDAATDIENGILDYPAMWTIFAGERAPDDIGGGRFRYEPNFLVFVAAESWSSKTFTTDKADTLSPGAYQLMLDVRAMLVSQTLGLEIEPLTPGRVRIIEVGQNVSVIALEFSTRYEAEPAPFDNGNLADFLRFRADYDFPPIGNVRPPMPAAEADARDAVDLPGPAVTS